MKFFSFVIIIIVFLIKTGNVLSNEGIFNVNNIEIDALKFKNNKNYIDDAFKKGFGKLTNRILLEKDYIKTKQESYFTVETHLRHLNEAKEGMLIIAKTQVLEASGKKLRLFHKLETDNGTLIATGEHMLLHVSLKTRASCLPSKKIAENLDFLYKKHSQFSLPEGAGRSVGYKG